MTNLIVKWDAEGMHYWPDAPEEFAVYGHPHEHIFHFVCYLPVKVSSVEDRPLELLKVRRELIKKMETKYGNPLNFGPMSCEGIAQSLYYIIRNGLAIRSKVVVMEDKFVGADYSDLEFGLIQP